jgi:uncharacterized protein
MDFSFLSGPTDGGTLAAGLLIAGAAAGLAAGTLKIGGGLVAVPALFIAFSEMGVAEEARMPLAVATALASSLPTALAFLHKHWREKTVDWSYVRRRGWTMATVALIGGAAAAVVPALYAVAIFAFVALAVAAWLIVCKADARVRAFAPAGAGPRAVHLLAGALGAFTGIGAATLCTPYLTRAGAEENVIAAGAALDVAVAAAGAVALALCGLAFRDLPGYSLGFVNLAAFAVIAPTMFLAAGFAAAHVGTARISALRKVYALFVLVTAGKMVWMLIA